jgi:hypothetical protein
VLQILHNFVLDLVLALIVETKRGTFLSIFTTSLAAMLLLLCVFLFEAE